MITHLLVHDFKLGKILIKSLQACLTSAMPKPSKQTAARRENWAAAQAVLEQNSDQETLERNLLESQAQLQTAQQKIATLESALSDKVAAFSELSISLHEADMKSEEYLSQLAEKKAQYHSLYKELCLERQWAKRANFKKANLEQQVSLLKAAALSQSHELKNMSVKAQKAIDSLLQLENQNSTLNNKVSQISRQKCNTARISFIYYKTSFQILKAFPQN